MAPRPRVLIETRELPASPDGVAAARVWDVILEYPSGFAFRYKRPARSRAQAEEWQGRFDIKLRCGQVPQLARHWIGLTEEVVGRLMAPPIIRVSRRWEPGLHVVRDGVTSPARQESVQHARSFRLILVGAAAVVQHPEVFGIHEMAERMHDAVQRQLDHGRDLVGHDWELTDLFPCGRTIAYLPSVRVLPPRHGRRGSAFRYNYFVSDADRFSGVRNLARSAKLRIVATASSYKGHLQWKVASIDRTTGEMAELGVPGYTSSTGR